MDLRTKMLILNTGVTPYSNKVLGIQTANLIAYWPLTDAPGTTTVADASGNGRTGTAGANVTMGQPGISMAGKTAAAFSGTTINAGIGLYSTSLRDAFNKDELTIAIWGKVLNWNDGTVRQIFQLRTDVSNRVLLQRSTTNGGVQAYYVAGGTTKTIGMTTTSPSGFFHMCLTVSKAADEMILYFEGKQYYIPTTGLGTWTGVLASALSWIGGYVSGVGFWDGSAAHCALWSIALTPAEVSYIAAPAYGNYRYLYVAAVGDSKTAIDPGWPEQMENVLEARNIREVSTTRIAVSGYKVSDLVTFTPARILLIQGAGPDPDEVLINAGANDCTQDIVQATWKQSMLDLITLYNTAFPAANIRIAKIWRRNDTYEASSIIKMNAAIDELYAEHAYLKTAINEALLIEGGDDGATYTVDGIHPNAAGNALEGAAWAALIGL